MSSKMGERKVEKNTYYAYNIYMKVKYYDKKEKEVIESVEKREWAPIENPEEKKKRCSKIFRVSSIKSERVTINWSKKDQKDLKIRVGVEDSHYQMLIESVLHKFVSGRFIEKSG